MGGLRCAFDRPHHRESVRRRVAVLRSAGRSDFRCARQCCGFAGMREACGRQFVRARRRCACRVVRRPDRMHGVPEWRLLRTGPAHDWSRRMRCHNRALRWMLRGSPRRSRRRSAVVHGTKRGCSGRRTSQHGDYFHSSCIAGVVGRMLATQILYLRRGQWLTVLAGDDLLACGKPDWPRWWLMTRHDWSSERFATLEYRRMRGRATQAQAGRPGIDPRTQCDLGTRKLGAIQFDQRAVHGSCIGEYVARYCGYGTRHPAIGVVMPTTRRHPPPAVIAVEIVDDRPVDVDVADVGDVDVGEVTPGSVKPRHVHIAWTQWEPADRPPAANVQGQRESGAADERDQRRRVNRTHIHRTRHPAPAVADVNPSPVVERRESPGFVVDPGPAPRIDPGPVSVPVWCPADRHRSRIPHVAVVGRVVPLAVLIELVAADHVGRHVAVFLLGVTLVVSVARFAEAVESVRWRQAVHVDAGQGRVVEAIRGSRDDLPTDAVFAVHGARPLEHGDHAAGAGGVVVDAINAGRRGDEGDGRGVHFEVGTLIELSHGQVQRALRQFDLDVVLGEIKEIEGGVVVDPDRRIAEFQHRATVIAGQQAIADHHRAIHVD